jgi:hypothetical protein
MIKKNFSEDSKDRYAELCNSETTMPIFSQPWWLDCVSGESNWGVCLVEQDGEIVASMPYEIEKRVGFNLCKMPILTQTLGPWIRPSKLTNYKQLSRQKKLMNLLIDQLPDYDYFSQNWHYSQTNFIPFFWRGFQQRTKYTYLIEDLSDLDKVWDGFEAKTKLGIKNARDRFKLIIDETLTIDDFINLHRQVFHRQNIEAPFSNQSIISLNQACKDNNASKIFIAIDEDGQKHAGVYLIWDKNCAYYLMGGSDPEFLNSGAVSFCLWEAIKFASTVVNKFDFEGSMIESIEPFVRAFGAKQKTYHSITKTSSLILRMRSALLQVRS